MAGLKPFDLTAARGAGIQNALNMQKFQQNVLSPGGGTQLWTYNPRDYTAESWATFAQNQDPSVLKRFTRWKKATVGGVKGFIDSLGEMPCRPSGTLKGEVEAKRQLSFGAKESGLQADIQYQLDIDIQEIQQLQKLSDVDLACKTRIKP